MRDWTFSHSQLALFRLCSRRYHDYYILTGKGEPATDIMAFSTWFVHKPIEMFVNSQTIDWDVLHANFLAEFGGSETYDHPIYNIKTAKRILELYKKHPIKGVEATEHKYYFNFPRCGHRYVSKPDFVSGAKTIDLKFTTAWEVKPLLPYDDQLLGQAICAERNTFCRYTIKCDKKTGKLEGPYIEEHNVDPALRNEWIEENYATILAIEHWRNETGISWPKSDGACYAFGRECARIKDCSFGFPDLTGRSISSIKE